MVRIFGLGSLWDRLTVFGALAFIVCMLPNTASDLSHSAESDLSNTQQWNFDSATPGSLPGAFVVGTLLDGRPAGEWKILITDRAESGAQVLAQLSSKGTDQAHKLLLVEETNSANIRLSVSYLAVSGKADQGGGLVWHASDDRNYYLVRASLVEQKIRLYRMIKGVQHLIKQIDHALSAGWHQLQITHQGCEIRVFSDDDILFRVCDGTFASGRIGLWTKADAVTYFDDVELQLLK